MQGKARSRSALLKADVVSSWEILGSVGVVVLTAAGDTPIRVSVKRGGRRVVNGLIC